MAEERPRHGYWKIRGYGHFSRATFFAAGHTDFEETQYTDETEGDWFGNVKPSLKHPLANLPFVVIDGTMVSEHDACMRAIAMRYKPELLGANLADRLNVETWFCALVKTTPGLRGLCYSKDPTAEGRTAAVQKDKILWAAANNRLAEHNFIATDYCTIADIYMAESIEVLRAIDETEAAQYANFQKYLDHFYAQEWFQTFKNSEKYVNGPLNYAPMASINKDIEC